VTVCMLRGYLSRVCRLFEMGFQDQLHSILARLPESRQTLLFSATLPKLLIDFAKAGLHDPTLIRLDVDTKISDQLKVLHSTAFCCSDMFPSGMGSPRTVLGLEDSSRTKNHGLGLEDCWPWPWPWNPLALALKTTGLGFGLCLKSVVSCN